MNRLDEIDEVVREERVYAYEELLPLKAVALLEWAATRIRELETQQADARNMVGKFIAAWYDDLGGDTDCIPAREFIALQTWYGVATDQQSVPLRLMAGDSTALAELIIDRGNDNG
jgi:hypothetical protein